MGYWWKDVSDTEMPIDVLALTIEGDSEAWPKNKAPILWRFQHRFVIVEVNHLVPFHLYFDDSERKMMFRKPISQRYFAARIGPKTVKFVAVGNDGIPFELEVADERRWSYFDILTITNNFLTVPMSYYHIGNTKMV